VANFATGTAGVVDIGCKFATGANDTGGKFAAGVTLICEYLREFSKNCKRPQWYTQGLGDKLIQEKNLKSKISCQCSCNRLIGLYAHSCFFVLFYLSKTG
jgi:hypothetical protein